MPHAPSVVPARVNFAARDMLGWLAWAEAVIFVILLVR